MCLVVGLDGMGWLQPSFWGWLQSLSVCLVPGPSGLGWFHPLFWGWLQPISCLVNSFRLGWFHPIFCLVGEIGKEGQMVYLTPFATVLMGPTRQGHILSSFSPQRIRPTPRPTRAPPLAYARPPTARPAGLCPAPAAGLCGPR